jgi:hypothetical protein
MNNNVRHIDDFLSYFTYSSKEVRVLVNESRVQGC